MCSPTCAITVALMFRSQADGAFGMRMHLGPLVVTAAIAIAGVFAGSASAEIAQSRPTDAAKYLAPSTVSSRCRSDASRLAACGVIIRFFRALNSSLFKTACTLLGERLRDENCGLGCPRFLSAGYPEPMPWGILGVRRGGSGIAVLVALGQSELGHIRTRLHYARVDFESGRLRILETWLVR